MVKQKIIAAIKNKLGFLTHAQNTILSAAVIISLASGLNAILGIVKSRLLSAYFGTSSDLTIFFTADKIPGLLYSLFVVGALSTVFLEIQRGALLLRLMLGAQIILLISSFLTGLLQSHNRFLLTGLAPLFYNLGLIAGTIIFSNRYGILGPTYGVIIGAIAHLAIHQHTE